MDRLPYPKRMLPIAAALTVVLIALAGLWLPGCSSAGDEAAAPVRTTAQAPTQAAALPDYWPTAGWRTSTPEQQGMSSAALVEVLDQIEQQRLDLHSLLIVRNGYLVADVYYDPYTAGQPVPVASVTKSIMSALVGIATDKGLIKDERAALLSFFPEKAVANLDDRKKAVTLQDLLTMTSGFDYPDTSDRSLSALFESKDWISFMLDRPVVTAPGSTFSYSTGSAHLLSGVLSKATGISAREFANENLFLPLGIAPVDAEHWGSDPQGSSFGGAGLSLTPRDMAKIGYLYLKNGEWDGRQVISSGWISSSTKPHATKDDRYGEGYLWTIDSTQGSFIAHGAGGQEIYVLPSKQLVVVMTAGLTAGQNQDFAPLKALFDGSVVPAVASDIALPADADGVARLADRINVAAHPLQPVSPLPALAHEVTGKIYELDANPAGWRTLQFTFADGESQASIAIDGTVLDPPVGLDNLFRVGQASGGVQRCFRGEWQPDGSFVIHEVDVGEQSELTHRIRFDGSALSITVTDSLWGQEMQIHGTAAPE